MRERAHDIDPRNPYTLGGDGDCFAALSDLDMAIEKYSKALEHGANKANVYILTRLGDAYKRKQWWNRAIEYFRKSHENNPENPSPANNLAVVYMTMGKFRLAKEILEEALKKNPDNEALKHNLKQAKENIVE